MCRIVVATALAIMPMLASDLVIDHVTAAGRHLDQMRQAFTVASGIPTEYGGPHANHATEMALSSFSDGSYVELIAIQPHADPAAVSHNAWSKFLNKDAGPCAFALRVSDVNAESARLKSVGIEVTAPERNGRTRPDGTRLEWETSDIGTGPRGTFFPFLIHDFTSRESRAFPSGNPTTNKVSGVAMVVIGVHSLGEAIAQYRRAFQLAMPHRQRDDQFQADLAWFAGTPIVLAQGLTGDSWLSQRVAEYGDSPCAIILASHGGMMGALESDWFGHRIFWADAQRLGWRLGMEARR